MTEEISTQKVRMTIIAIAIARPFMDTWALVKYLCITPVHLLLALRCAVSRDRELAATGCVLVRGTVRNLVGLVIAVLAGLASVVPVVFLGTFSMIAAEFGLVSSALAVSLATSTVVVTIMAPAFSTPDAVATIGVSTLVLASILYVAIGLLATSEEE